MKLDKLILDIFEAHGILFKTTKRTSSCYPAEVSFWEIYKAELKKLDGKESSEATINNHFRALEKKGFIVKYDQELHDSWFSGDPSISRLKIERSIRGWSCDSTKNQAPSRCHLYIASKIPRNAILEAIKSA